MDLQIKNATRPNPTYKMCLSNNKYLEVRLWKIENIYLY